MLKYANIGARAYYNWTLPGASNVSGTGNTRTFTSDGGDVTVEVSDADTPDPCTATATEHICGLAVTVALSPNLAIGDSRGAKYTAQVSAANGTLPFSVVWTFPAGAVGATGDGELTSGGSTYFKDAEFYLPYRTDAHAETISATVTDSASPPCQKTRSDAQSYSGDQPGDGCPAGQHDDGTGQCVPDEPTGPQPCASGYEWNGAACVPVAPPVDPVDPNGCCLPGYYREVAGGPCIPVPTLPPGPPSAPNAPVAAKDCATGVINITVEFPPGVTSIEIARDDAPDVVIAIATLNANGEVEWSKP